MKIKQNGFSLIELLVVLVILGLLMGVVAPQVMKNVGKAKSDSARLQIADLGAALDLYYLELGDYPSTAQGLSALITQPGDSANWNGPYLKKKRCQRILGTVIFNINRQAITAVMIYILWVKIIKQAVIKRTQIFKAGNNNEKTAIRFFINRVAYRIDDHHQYFSSRSATFKWHPR